jgi:hypothetical protein
MPSQKSQSQPFERQNSLKEQSIPLEKIPSDIPTFSSLESHHASLPDEKTSSIVSPLGLPGLIKNQSVDLNKIMSSSKHSLNAVDDDRLLDVEILAPATNKSSSQKIAENTLLLTHIARSNTFVDSKSIKTNHQGPRNYRNLSALQQDLLRRKNISRSQDLTLEIIQSRFASTGLDSIAEKNRKKAKPDAETKSIASAEESSDDSDFNPDDLLKKQSSESNPKPENSLPLPSAAIPSSQDSLHQNSLQQNSLNQSSLYQNSVPNPAQGSIQNSI